ncbi:preprotein translocase subunit SecE [Corynebacterium sp. 3HC-13]|uniref:preprotein translocase subunit SecE n=1 Tax=Corynebacterium poyangense TaxID=2684405 RepID=UPI001CCCF079|nr:preprotein translocase subunit SecE [Corynebacterium poyangense]MBZ8177664.1 preprotein translocase subunit SecE [Corynebacterium poyangense]
MSEKQPKKTGAPRPTGKRQLAGVSTTSVSAQKAATPAVARNNPDEKPGGGVAAFIPEVVAEMRKVVWPTAKQMVVYTVVVFAFLIIMTALTAGVDALVRAGVEFVLTPR